jgi:hypothetical protein
VIRDRKDVKIGLPLDKVEKIEDRVIAVSPSVVTRMDVQVSLSRRMRSGIPRRRRSGI